MAVEITEITDAMVEAFFAALPKPQYGWDTILAAKDGWAHDDVREALAAVMVAAPEPPLSAAQSFASCPDDRCALGKGHASVHTDGASTWPDRARGEG